MSENITRKERDSSLTTPYSVRNRGLQLVCFDGQVPSKETVLDQGVQTQTLKALERVRTVAAEAGVSRQELMRTTVYLTDMNQLEAVTQAYDEFFEGQRPSRTFVGVEQLPNDATVQIEATGVCK